ncbi:MAG: zinc dependent phospholipase C family protein [Bacteroidota bacterium]|nr:zinc dependent phospholipase C family protein [Bacteroidota bacterium]
MKRIFTQNLIVFLFLFLPINAFSFGVLTHEAIIDAAWERSILPLLKLKYPSSTGEEQKEARAYAYGGAVAPDMGFYPFGSPLFTNLIHYVRSGDMISALLKDAENINQYSFALGFLSHYNADNYGHPLATNKSVTLVYPDLRRKYGNVITYAENEISHMRMEFGFDVLQIAKGNYATDNYHGFIGFKVDTSVLARAFFETYGLDINDVFNHRFSLSVETFRWIVANIFPVITKAAWAQKKEDIVKQHSTITAKEFRFKMHQKEYKKAFGTGYKRPGFFPTILSLFIRVLPKIGPTRALKFKTPTPLAEKYFDESFDSIMKHYTINLKQLNNQNINLRDMDFDTGKPTAHCEYSLGDDTYNKLVLTLEVDKFKNVNEDLKQNILSFYNGMNPSLKYSKKCSKVFNAVNTLRNSNTLNKK